MSFPGSGYGCDLELTQRQAQMLALQEWMLLLEAVLGAAAAAADVVTVASLAAPSVLRPRMSLGATAGALVSLAQLMTMLSV